MDEPTTVPEGTMKTAQKTNPSLYDTYNCRHLRFLLDLFTALNLTPYSFGQMTDNPLSTAQALRAQLKKDDMKISRAKTIVGMTGYRLRLSFKDETKMIQKVEDYTLTLPAELSENLTRKKEASPYENLDFLHEFLQRRRISRRQLAQRIEVSPGAVETWFRADDCAISYLYRIKNSYDVELVFDIQTKE